MNGLAAERREDPPGITDFRETKVSTTTDMKCAIISGHEDAMADFIVPRRMFGSRRS